MLSFISSSLTSFLKQMGDETAIGFLLSNRNNGEDKGLVKIFVKLSFLKTNQTQKSRHITFSQT